MRETRTTEQPESQMAVRALVPGAVLAVAAFAAGFAVNGLRAGVSALLGVLLVSVSFAVYVMVLGRAMRISPAAMQGAVLGGWLVRLGVILGALFAVDAAGGDVAAFGFAAIVTALAVATYEAWALLVGRIRAPLELEVHDHAGSES
jgi:FtsH-binding integral membrane protein